jgi:DNA-binding XRE family transcriptional regulator
MTPMPWVCDYPWRRRQIVASPPVRYIVDMSKHDTRAFGRALRAARLKSGKSQGDLGKYLGVSTSYVSDIERGYRAPLTYDNLVKATHFLDADPRPLIAARAAWHGCVEVPLTGDEHMDASAVTLVLSALEFV